MEIYLFGLKRDYKVFLCFFVFKRIFTLLNQIKNIVNCSNKIISQKMVLLPMKKIKYNNIINYFLSYTRFGMTYILNVIRNNVFDFWRGGGEYKSKEDKFIWNVSIFFCWETGIKFWYSRTCIILDTFRVESCIPFKDKILKCYQDVGTHVIPTLPRHFKGRVQILRSFWKDVGRVYLGKECLLQFATHQITFFLSLSL
jgi:hypothetical protein